MRLTACIASQNPFGAAKPRETVLAAKLGKKEEDILKEELNKDKINVRILKACFCDIECLGCWFDVLTCAAAVEPRAK